MNIYAQAARYLAQVQRAGARHSAKDNSIIQQLHDLSCELGAECPDRTPESVTVEELRRYAPNPMLKAAVEALILRHPGHGNQKVHGNRFGAGQAKESLRRLKDDKGAREAYKATARGKRSSYHKDIAGGQEIFNKIKHGGTAQLRSHDDKLDVDISIKAGGGVMGLAVKKPGDKSFGKHRLMSENDAVNYLAQFKPRKDNTARAKQVDKDIENLVNKQNRLMDKMKQFTASDVLIHGRVKGGQRGAGISQKNVLNQMLEIDMELQRLNRQRERLDV